LNAIFAILLVYESVDQSTYIWMSSLQKPLLSLNVNIFSSVYFRVWCVQIILCVLPSTKHMQNVFVSMNEATEYFTLGSCKLFFIIKRVGL